MPVNLNALLRYKTIDSCLSNKHIICTLDLLIEKCSESLTNNFGINTSISERTIRNDIRIMRSDILGFDAPIVFKNGSYHYSAENYTVFGRPLKELELLKEIQELLVDNFDIIENKNTSLLLNKLSQITREILPEQYYLKSDGIQFNIKKGSVRKISDFERELIEYLHKKNKLKFLKSILNKFLKKKPEVFNWAFIFNSLRD